ncbi:type I glyceraldehyde-3-phosphate dehydrogenase [Nonlabens ulvanivorans]|uniref:Glyceraldehyde-3-phosphate dehydrogenase n=3 Tax=Nonlabens ulvanivorans TaxID=906888 RepID=A0A084JYY5_NONUL|nr:type I glyceraldehyde-3-phosphate dehydrogenase [Nonlabens ulvanivorans]KEZ94169.1 glyceraldehyde-3-phosphate dehydrogenase [Nonlabens ulvanivorans]PRX13158.1 glyceraldehyde 3-phosphate dehydrogenase [Nonlabens ulvanivorans]GAL00627.1 NAD-dependent glyceraldehyde-3-phosphate dehydrogenase [Nonlabens ulvanivorans]
MVKIKVAINGFGRIGRTFLRTVLNDDHIEVVAINDLASNRIMSHLLKYDSIHGTLSHDVTYTEDSIVINDKSILFTHHKNLEDLNWTGVDVVIESTGKFKTLAQLQKHRDAGAKKVILSAPPVDDDIKTVVLGVNDHIINEDDVILSNASCTTNNAAPFIKVLDELCGVEQAYITTVHSYTSDQSLHDQPHNDLRRARAAGQSIVPTTTGAAKALTKIFPHLSDVIGGCGIRVPVPNGSLTDMTINVKRDTSIDEVNAAFLAFAEANPNTFSYTDVPLVSIDISGSPYSCIFDSQMTSVIGKLIKVIGWYDNESGYSNRLKDLVIKIS